MCSVVLHQSFVCFFFINGIKTLFTNPDPTCPVLSLGVTSTVFHVCLPQKHHGTHQSPEAELEMEGGRRRGEEERGGGGNAACPHFNLLYPLM